jgi:hypothetical protein
MKQHEDMNAVQFGLERTSYMLYFHAACHLLHFRAVCSCCLPISMLHVLLYVFEMYICMSMLHVLAECTFCSYSFGRNLDLLDSVTECITTKRIERITTKCIKAKRIM